MSKYLSDKIPALAFVVLKKGKVVAKVIIKLPKDGASTVQAQCETWASDGTYQLQNGRAGGYGYDKQTAAIAGFVIDGHMLADHCGTVELDAQLKANRLLKQQMAGTVIRDWNTMAKKIGFRWANWQSNDKHPRGGCWTSLHPEAGLDRLRALGYQVIQAL